MTKVMVEDIARDALRSFLHRRAAGPDGLAVFAANGDVQIYGHGKTAWSVHVKAGSGPRLSRRVSKGDALACIDLFEAVGDLVARSPNAVDLSITRARA